LKIVCGVALPRTRLQSVDVVIEKKKKDSPKRKK
jgi:hypothetical protein